MKKSDDIKELAIALSNFQSEIGAISKTESNPFFKSKYADLASVWNAIREPLSKNGLCVSQHPEGGPESVMLITLLMHKSGQWLESGYETKPNKTDPQGMGSATTYARRYGLMAVLGLVADVDDDGNAASKPVQNKPEIKDPNLRLVVEAKEELINAIRAERTKKNLELEAVTKLTGIKLDSETSIKDLQEVLNAIIKYKPQSA